MCCIPSCSSVLFFPLLFQQIYGFTFTVSQPRQCGGLQFDWVGGTPPFTALILVPFGITKDVTIPAQSWNGATQSGDFSYLLPLNQSQKVVFSMGDATGPTAGGITDVMTVGALADATPPCDTSSPSTDFTFETDLPLLQCKSYSFSHFGSAAQPISVLVTVPLGESFTLTAPRGDPFVWKANLTTGTSVMFTVKDAENHVGGTSRLLSVGPSDDSSCLSLAPVSASPTRLPQVTTTSLNSLPTHTPNQPENGNEGGTRSNGIRTSNNTPLIIRCAVGGSVGLLAIAAVVFCFIRRRRRRDAARRDELLASVPGVATSFLPPGQMQYDDKIPPTSYSVNPNVGVPPTGQSNGFSPAQVQVTPAPYSVDRYIVPPASRRDGFPPGQMQYHDQVAPTPHFVNPIVGAQATSRNTGFPLDSLTLASIGNGPDTSPSTPAAITAPVQTEPSAGSMDTKVNHSAMSFRQEAVYPQKGERHLYYDPFARNWPQQDYDSDRYADASSSSQRFETENMSGSGAGPAFDTSASVKDGKATSQTRKSLVTSTSFTTQPPRPVIVHTDMDDELPPVYSDIRSGIPLSSAAPTGDER